MSPGACSACSGWGWVHATSHTPPCGPAVQWLLLAQAEAQTPPPTHPPIHPSLVSPTYPGSRLPLLFELRTLQPSTPSSKLASSTRSAPQSQGLCLSCYVPSACRMPAASACKGEGACA